MRSKPTENTMHRMLLLGVLILSVTPLKVAGNLNFTKHVDEYIQKLNSTMQNITSWGMTESYSYWAEFAGANKTQPITATAGAINLTSPLEDLIPLTQNYQFEIIEYFINLTKSLYGPFLLPTNISLELYKNRTLKKRNVTFYMNNRALAQKLTRVSRAVRVKGQARRIYSELQKGTGSLRKWFSHTKFTVNVTFSGSIAYETKSSARNETQYQTLDVGKLNDTSKGLLRKGKNLTYTFQGVYGRYIVFRDISTYKASIIW
ncbi:uncharacterized protein LOC144130304 isoform X1 [Amblyomma americanum]